jgi:hypothetical protein
MIYLYDSYFKALAGFEAFVFTAVNNNTRILDCTIMHGSLGANNPIKQTGGVVNIYSSYSRWNAQHAATAINLIATPNDLYDPLCDY